MRRRDWVLLITFGAVMLSAAVAFGVDQAVESQSVREHLIAGSEGQYYASSRPPRLYHYPTLEVCVLRGYEARNFSGEGGPWAVVVPCPWHKK